MRNSTPSYYQAQPNSCLWFQKLLPQYSEWRQRFRRVTSFVGIFPQPSLADWSMWEIFFLWNYHIFPFTYPPLFSSLACLCWGRVSIGGYFHIVSCLTFHNLPHQGSFETDWIPNSLIYFWQLICTNHQFLLGCRKWTCEIYLFTSPISPISSLVLVFSSSQCNKTGVVRPLCLLLPPICSSGLHPQIECPSTIEALV